ncbi:MAG: DUF3179 domain-containing protein [Chloroflexi bacterium]|nr:DUF3179 domain-containing protein [Chloroflexota bacterium]
MLNGIAFFTSAGVLGPLLLAGVACASQATLPAPVGEPSTVQSAAQTPVESQPLAATPTSLAVPEATTQVQDASKPTPPPRIAATAKSKADVEFFMSAALDALLDTDGPPDDPRSFFEPPWASELRQVALQMSRSGNTAYIPLIIDFMRLQFSQQGRAEQGSFLASLAGEQYDDIPSEDGDWGLWVEWLGKHPEVRPPPGYDAWKGEFLGFLDPGMGAFFYDGVKTNIRLEEAVWGGVPKDGIPDLVNPPVVPGNQASYLGATDRVFGVSINGEHRAYPLRVLNPHEMANDVLGGEPISLAY